MSKPTARDAILDTAERLFSKQGTDSVSLRTINTEAGYSVAALHYHFGTRENLIDTLLEERRHIVLQRREALLELLKTSDNPDIHQIAEALVLPLAEPIFQDLEKGLYTVKFFFRVYIEQRNSKTANSMTQESLRIFSKLLSDALPHIDKETLLQRWNIATELTLQGLANIDQIANTRRRDTVEKKYRRYTRQLVDFIAAGLAAEENE